MAGKTRYKKTSPAGRAMILGVLVCIPAFFVLVVMGTNEIFDRLPYLIIAVLAVGMAIYSGSTSSLLYKYFEVRPPWYRWVPCYGELALMDGKYLFPGTLLYVLAIISFLIGQIPYSITKNLGETIAFGLPFYSMLLSMVLLLAVQVVKGIGILNCMKVMSEEWNDKMHTSIGLIKSFVWFGFIPFVRVVAVYALNKPLSTLVTFNDISISDDNDIVLEEAEEDED